MMSSVDLTAPDPSVVSNIPPPPFVSFLDPDQLFLACAARSAMLAGGHEPVPHLRSPSSLRFDPVAADVAMLGFDLLVRELGLCRGGIDPFLIGY